MKWEVLGKLKTQKSKVPPIRRAGKNLGQRPMSLWLKNSKLNVEEVVDLLLRNRGVKTKKEKEEFLQPRNPMEKGFWDDVIKGKLKTELGKAVERIVQAIKQRGMIVIYGDYDVDGICGTAILWETINSLGGRVMPYIPERFEDGYGIKAERVEKLKEKWPDLRLVITVDNGIVANKAIEEISVGGVEVIVTDHHETGKDLPKAKAVVHTTELSGSGVTWVLALRLARGKLPKAEVKEKLGLVAMGTVADLLPLVGMNRSLVKWGLEELRRTERVGVRAICGEARIKQEEVGTYEIGYVLGPRLNAAGRMASAMAALRLICTPNGRQAAKLAEELEVTNRERQQVLSDLVEKARGMWEEKERRKLIFLSGEEYHEGVIGLVAGRLVEEFHLPAIVVARGERYSKASARSVPGLNIIEVIREASAWLVDAGGHAAAAGFTVATERMVEVEEKLTGVVEERLTREMLKKSLRVDMELPFETVDLEMAAAVGELAPFGLGNSVPVFASYGVEVREARLVGSEGKHLRLRLGKDDKSLSAIGFGMGGRYEELPVGEKVDAAYNLSVDEWQGERRVELRLKDVKIS